MVAARDSNLLVVDGARVRNSAAAVEALPPAPDWEWHYLVVGFAERIAGS